MASLASVSGVKANGSKWKQSITFPFEGLEDKIDDITECVERLRFVDSIAKAIVKRLESLKSGTHDGDLKDWIEEFQERFTYPDGYEIEEDDVEFKYINDEFIHSLNGLFDIFDYHRILVKDVRLSPDN